MRKIDYKALSPEMINLIAFIAVLLAVLLLAKPWSSENSGVDLSIMTGLIGLLGALVNNFRKAQPIGVEQAETVNQNGGDNEVDNR